MTGEALAIFILMIIIWFLVDRMTFSPKINEIKQKTGERQIITIDNKILEHIIYLKECYLKQAEKEIKGMFLGCVNDEEIQQRKNSLELSRLRPFAEVNNEGIFKTFNCANEYKQYVFAEEGKEIESLEQLRKKIKMMNIQTSGLLYMNDKKQQPLFNVYVSFSALEKKVEREELEYRNNNKLLH